MFNIIHTINSANDEDCVVLPTIENTEHLVNVINHVAQYNQGTVVIGFDTRSLHTYGVDETIFLSLYKAAQCHLMQVETRLLFIDYRVFFKLAVIDVKKSDPKHHGYSDFHDDNTNIKLSREYAHSLLSSTKRYPSSEHDCPSTKLN